MVKLVLIRYVTFVYLRHAECITDKIERQLFTSGKVNVHTVTFLASVHSFIELRTEKLSMSSLHQTTLYLPLTLTCSNHIRVSKC